MARRTRGHISHDPRWPQRRHLRRLKVITVPDPTVYLLTLVVEDRHPVLACPEAAGILLQVWKHSDPQHGWLIGRWVVMPDHVHFFGSPAGDAAKSLSTFIACWKRSTKRCLRRMAGMTSFSWQDEFFDHVVRDADDYSRHWEYVCENPVRKGLVADASEWPYQGGIHIFRW
jgi:putative transposase